MRKRTGRCGGLACACVLALHGQAALAEFETVASGAPVQDNPFRISPFYGSVVLTFGHDSNLLLVPDAPPFHTGEQAGNFVLVTLAGGVLFPVSERLTFGAELSGTLVRTFGTQPAGTSGYVTDPKDYARHVLQPKVWAQFSWPVAGGAFTLTPSYTYRFEGGSKVHAVGSKSHILRLDAGYDLSADTKLTAWAMHANTDFDVEFPAQPTRNRDGDYTEAGVALRHCFNNDRSAFSLGLAVERNDAKGRDWQFDGTRVFAGAFSGGSSDVEDDPADASDVKIFYLQAINNATARLREQAAAPNTLEDLRNRMNEHADNLASFEPEVSIAEDPSPFSDRASTLLEDAADLMIEAGNLKIKQLYDRPPAEGGGNWINAWWDYSSP